MDKYVITISRQFGALGRTIAQKMAAELGIEFYDRDIVEHTAKRMGLPVSEISKEEERAGIFDNRDICIDSGKFGADTSADILCGVVRSVFD